MSRYLLAATLLLTSLPTLGFAGDLPSKSVLTFDLADEMIAACFAAQETAGYARVNVIVVDDGGQLIAAARQDGACKACSDIAHDKAVTAALFANTTRAFA